MHVALLAWCPTSPPYVDALVAGGASEVTVVTGARSPARAPLSASCARVGARVVLCDDPRAPHVAADFTARRPELALVAGWPTVLSSDVLASTRLGFVNAHPSLLPRYRGREPLFWALVAGEEEVGITLHLMTRDVDAGPILLQRRVPVPPRATARSLAAEVDRIGADLVGPLLDQVRVGRFPSARPQPQGATHFSPLTDRDVRIDWSRPSRVVDRLVRASVGHLPAYAQWRGMKLVVSGARPVSRSVAAAPGTVLEVSRQGWIVATGSADGPDALEVRRFEFCGRLRDPVELARALEVAAGARLESRAATE